MEKINKHSVLKAVRENGSWKGYIAPNKVNAFHINNGWHIGMKITIVSGREVNRNDKEYFYFSEENEAFTELETWLNSYMYYNCSSNELGTRVSYWTE
jgi:hypothetical protein